jgi:hypothetical protein
LKEPRSSSTVKETSQPTTIKSCELEIGTYRYIESLMTESTPVQLRDSIQCHRINSFEDLPISMSSISANQKTPVIDTSHSPDLVTVTQRTN